MVNLDFHPLLCFLLATFFNSLLIDSSLSNILNVSRTWTQWLTTLLSSHVLTILKHAAYTTMLRCLICKCFFCSLSIRFSKNKRDKKPSTNIFRLCRTWTQCLAALLCSHVLAILKNASNTIMPRGLLCFSIRLSENTRNKKDIDKNFAYVAME